MARYSKSFTYSRQVGTQLVLKQLVDELSLGHIVIGKNGDSRPVLVDAKWQEAGAISGDSRILLMDSRWRYIEGLIEIASDAAYEFNWWVNASHKALRKCLERNMSIYEQEGKFKPSFAQRFHEASKILELETPKSIKFDGVEIAYVNHTH